jgi:type III secretion protein T
MPDDLTRPLLLTLLCLIRPLAAFRTAPLLGATVIPPQVLNAFILALTLLFYPVASATAPAAISYFQLLPLVVKEVGIGLIIGFFLGILFWAADSFGSLIDNQRGASMAQGMDPLSGDQLSPYASFFFQFAAMLFFSSGAFVSFIGMLCESYAVWPLFEPLPRLTGSAMRNLMLLEADMVLRLALLLAAPVMALCFLTDFGLGLVNRFAQQLNVFVLSMPVKSAVALFVLTLYAYAVLRAFHAGVADMNVLFLHLRDALQ